MTEFFISENEKEKFKEYSKTINNNFLKQKINLNKNGDKSDSTSKISNKTINKRNSLPYINNKIEGNSYNYSIVFFPFEKMNLWEKPRANNKRNEKYKERQREKEKLRNDNQIKIPLLEVKNKAQLLKPNNGFVPRNCISAKNRRKAL